MSARILVVAATKSRAKHLSQRVQSIPMRADVATTSSPPAQLDDYTLLIWEQSVRAPEDPRLVISRLGPAAHVILLRPKLTTAAAAHYLQDPRLNHFLRGPTAEENLEIVAKKLATGAIFGLEWYLPPEAGVEYRRIDTYRARCEAIEELESRLKGVRLRASLVRSTVRVLEELLMNAMYQAPVDEKGRRYFEDVDPRRRIRKKTPRPVSLRWAVHDQRVFLCVRDRYGSFQRDDMARCLLRCTTSAMQIEDKKLGAGLGLYLIASTVSGLIINILPGMVSEFICVLGPKVETDGLSILSVTTQRARQLSSKEEGSEPDAELAEPV